MKNIVTVAYERGDIHGIPGFVDEVGGLEDLLLSGDTCTAMADGGVVVFVLGVRLYWPGHAEGYLYCRPDVRNWVKAFAIMRGFLEQRIDRHRLRRVTAHCKSDWPAANRLLVHLGFRLEATLTAYGPAGEDYNIYGRLTEWR